MAATKQGYSAHLKQKSEDLKVQILNSAPTSIKSHSWLSNLNTTCTIKSAPPRTPEVMAMLAVKDGWLVKRNEQHVWQRRYCCVVPHTFLYYFEAEPNWIDEGDSNGYEGSADSKSKLYVAGGKETEDRNNAAIIEDQDRLNEAVKNGFNSDYQSSSNEKIHSWGQNGHGKSQHSSREILRGPTTTNNHLLPVGIIDLECYTNVNRSTVGDTVFELTGDSITNPDLRTFYFQAGSVDDAELWTKALLGDRHSALKDESEAYRQVCDSFQLQLQSLSDMIDTADVKAVNAEKELYRVRSTHENIRVRIINIVREVLETDCWGRQNPRHEEKSSSDTIFNALGSMRTSSLAQLDKVKDDPRTEGATHVVTLMAEYLATITASYTSLKIELTGMEQRLTRSANIDKATLSEIEIKLEHMGSELEQERAQHKEQISKLKDKYFKERSVMEELEQSLQTQSLEFTMYKKHAKSKLQELSKHKKILKREVIECRKNIDELGSERDAACHQIEQFKLQYETEKEKNSVMERYMEKLENQVQTQHNMMEMMSQTGSHRSSSVLGKVIGPDIRDRCASKSQLLPPSSGKFSNQRVPTQNDTLSSEDSIPINNLSQNQVHKELYFKSKEHEEHIKIIKELPPTISLNEVEENAEGTVKREVLKIEGGNTDASTLNNKSEANSEIFSEVPIAPKLKLTEELITQPGSSSNDDNDCDPPKNNQFIIPQSNENAVDDEDAISHISELTEDRTQRDINMTEDVLRSYRRANEQQQLSISKGNNAHSSENGENVKRTLRPNQVVGGGETRFPPRYILGTNDGDNESKKQPARESSMKCPEKFRLPPLPMKCIETENYTSERYTADDLSIAMRSVNTTGSGKLSVAQRARLESEKSHVFTISSVLVAKIEDENRSMDEKVDHPPPQSTASQSYFSNFGKTLFDAIDNSSLGVSVPDDAISITNSIDTLEFINKKHVEPMKKMSLAERKQQQKIRQMEVLKKSSSSK